MNLLGSYQINVNNQPDPNLVDSTLSKIAKTETGGQKNPYATKTATKRSPNEYALGKYQIVNTYLPDYSKRALGRTVSEQEFLSNPQLQDQIARANISQDISKFGVQGAVSKWFSGSPNVNAKVKDRFGTTPLAYVQKTLGTSPVPSFGNTSQSSAQFNPKSTPTQSLSFRSLLGNTAQASTGDGIDFQPIDSSSQSSSTNLDFQPIDFQPNPIFQTNQANQGGVGSTTFNPTQGIDTLKSIGSFLTGSEQGTAKDIAATKTTFDPASLKKMSDSANQLIQHANTLPQGDPRRTQLLNIAKNISDTASGQANEQLSNIPSNLQAGLDVGGVGADVLSAGTYKGVTQAGMKTGELFTKGIPSLVTAGEKAVSQVGESLAKRSAQKTTDKIVEAVSPKLTAKETASAVAQRGTTKTGLFGKIKTVVDPYTKKIADTVQKLVPDFSKAKTLAEKINLVRETSYKLAADLKQQVIASGKDIIYPFQELSSRLNKIEEPISLKGTPFEKQVGPIKKAAIAIAQKAGGTVSSLYDAMKEFDALINKTYPNLYDKEYSAMRTVIKGVRDTLSDFAAEKLPDVAFQETRTQISHLITATENMAEKAAAGAQKEIGTTALKRFGTNHPVAKRVLQGAAGALGYEEARKYLPILP